MHDVAALVQFWQGPDSAAPRLTWYDGDERVELSGRVLANWVIKVANLLTEEADADPSTHIVIDLPMHWRHCVWALGAWLAGAQVHSAAGGEHAVAADVLVTTDPTGSEDAEVIIAVALPAFAMQFEAPLPAGVIDGAADLMTYPDVLVMPTHPADLTEIAIGTPVAQRAVLAAETGALGHALALWCAGGSVVLSTAAGGDLDTIAQAEGAIVQ